MTYTFGDVRALVHHPSKKTWHTLIERLCDWPDARELQDVILPYCAQALDSWPDVWRHASPAWTQAALEDITTPHPGVVLAKALVFLSKSGSPSWLKLWDHYDLSGVTRLKLVGSSARFKLPKNDFSRLFERLEAQQLVTLELSDVKLKPEQWASVFSWPGLDRLRTLSLDRCRLVSDEQDDEASPLRALVAVDPGALEHLCLQNNKLRGPDIALLAQSKFSRQLKTLRFGATPDDPYFADRHVWYNRIEVAGMEALCDAANFQRLEALGLSYNLLDREMLKPLFEASMPALTHLDLNQNYMKSPEGKALAKSPFINRLEALDVSGNKIGANATIALCDVLDARTLHTLQMNKTNPGGSGVSCLMRTERLRGLRTLGLSDNGLHTEQLPLFEGCVLDSLEFFSFLNNTLSKESYQDFLKAPFLSSLHTLKIPSLSDAQVIEVLEHPALQGLERLGVESRRDVRNAALAAHPLGHKLEFMREVLYHYINYTPSLIPLPGTHDEAPSRRYSL